MSTINSRTKLEIYNGATWDNILGEAHYVQIHRGGNVEGVTDVLEPGTMTAEVLDPAVDPATNANYKPGVKMRLMANISGTYTAVFTGRILTMDTVYGKYDPKTRVTFVVSDCLTQAKNYKKAKVQGGCFRQRINDIMSTQTSTIDISYTVTDSDSDQSQTTISNVGSGATIDKNKGATVYDQLQIAANTNKAIIYPDKSNVLKCYANNSLPTSTPSQTFRDTTGTGIKYYAATATFGSRGCVNEVYVEKHNVDLKDGVKTYGPYANPTSQAAWGVFSAVLVTNDFDSHDLAHDYMVVYNHPDIFVSDVTFNSTDDLSLAQGLELYQAVTMRFKAAIDTVRIIGIEHDITPDKWLTTVTFKPLGASDTITVADPFLGPDSGPDDMSTPYETPFAYRYVSVDDSVNDTTVKNIHYGTNIETTDTITWDGTNDRFVVSIPGRYQINAAIAYANNATGRRSAAIYTSGTQLFSHIVNAGSGGPINVNVSGIYRLAASDTLSVRAWQNSGGALAIKAGQELTYITITWLGD
jgi:hypothetical protein